MDSSCRWKWRQMVSAVLRGTTEPRIRLWLAARLRRLPKCVSRRWRRLRADSGDVQQFGVAVAHLAALAVVANGEAVAFVADHLHEMQYRRVAVEDDWFVFLSVDVDDFLSLGDGGERLVDDAERLKASAAACSWPRPPSMRIRLGHWLVFFLEAPVAARDDFAHGGEVVDADDGPDVELAVVATFHLAVFPHDHGGDGLRTLDVRDVEALDALWAVRASISAVLRGFLDGFARWASSTRKRWS